MIDSPGSALYSVCFAVHPLALKGLKIFFLLYIIGVAGPTLQVVFVYRSNMASHPNPDDYYGPKLKTPDKFRRQNVSYRIRSKRYLDNCSHLAAKFSVAFFS